MDPSIEETVPLWHLTDAEFSALIYPNANGPYWDVVIYQALTPIVDGEPTHGLRQLLRRRISSDGPDAIVSYLTLLGWTVAPMTTWLPVPHDAVQRGYLITLGAPELPVDFSDRPPHERWIISECMRRGMSAPEAAEHIDAGIHTPEEIMVIFELEAHLDTVVGL